MKIIVLKNNLKEGLIAVEKAISENNNLPILKNVLLKTDNNLIQISATNLDLAVTKFVSGKIIEDGSITIPFNTFYNIVNNSDSEKINLEKKDKTLIFKTDNYEAKIQGLDEEEFPIIPKIENSKNYLEIDSAVLKNSILKIVSAAQLSEIRPEISGILLDFQLTILKLVATDSFRLAEKTLASNQFKTNFNRNFKIIIPLKTVQEILRIFKEDTSVTLFIDPNQILVKTDDVQLISRLIDGNYPDYEQIIPKSLETETQIERLAFMNAVKLVSNFSGKTNDIKLKIKDKKILEVYSANQYLGENNYLIPVKIKGEGFEEVGFNWRYLMDGLKAVDSEKVVFGVNGSARPTMIKSLDDATYFYILMPIKS